MQRVHDAIIGWLEDEGIPFTKADQGYAIHISVEGKKGEWDFVFDLVEGLNVIIAASILPFRFPPALRQECASFQARANCDLLLGRFELDMGEGMVLFRVTQIVDASVERWILENMYYDSIQMVDRYFPGFEAVLRGDLTGGEAFDSVWEDVDDEDLNWPKWRFLPGEN